MRLPTIDRRRSEGGFGERKIEAERLAEASRFTATAATVRDVTQHLHEGGLRVKRDKLTDEQAAELVALTTKASTRASGEEAEPHSSPGFNVMRLDAKERRKWELLAALGAGMPESYFDDRRRDSKAFGELEREAVELRKPPRRMQAAPEGSITIPRAWLAALEPSSLGVLAMLLATFESGELPVGAHPSDCAFEDGETLRYDVRHGVPWGDEAELYGQLAYYEDGSWLPAWKDALLELATLTVKGKRGEEPLFELEQGRVTWTLRFNRSAYDRATGAVRT